MLARSATLQIGRNVSHLKYVRGDDWQERRRGERVTMWLVRKLTEIFLLRWFIRRLQMPQTIASTFIAISLLAGFSSAALAQSSHQLVQAQQNRSQFDRDYQQRLNAAQSPQERARIEAEYDRMRQEGRVPDPVPHVDPDTGIHDPSVRSGPGAAPDPGQGPGGGGSVPRGQGD